MNKSLTFLLHSRITDENGPHIGTGLGDHQHTDHGDGIGPKNNGNVEPEAQHDGHPHPAKSRVVMLLGTAVEQHDDQQAHQCKRNVTVNAPGQRGFGAQPLVLRHHAQDNTHGSQTVDGGSQAIVALDPVALTPDIVQQHIKDREDTITEEDADYNKQRIRS